MIILIRLMMALSSSYYSREVSIWSNNELSKLKGEIGNSIV